MERGWLIGMPFEMWEGVKNKKPTKLPPSWHTNWINGFEKPIKPYSIFFGCCTDSKEILCAGLTLTSPYVTPDGWTVEILPRFAFDEKVALNDANVNQDMYYFMPLDERELQQICSQWGSKKRSLKRRITQLEHLAKREQSYETLAAFLERCGCTTEEVYDVIRTMVKVVNGGNSKEELEELRQLIDYIAFLVHADERTPKQWAMLWRELLTMWREFATILRPAEMKRIEKEPTSLLLVG